MHANRCNVLVVDDSVDHQFLYGRMLCHRDEATFTVASVGTARAAMSAIRNQLPDCILLDLDLPDIGGLAFLESLRESFGRLPCAVVIITASGSEAVAVEAMKRGVQDYLVKGQVDASSLGKAVIKAVDDVYKQRMREDNQARMVQMALHDSLTGLANRANFDARVRHALDLAKRSDMSVALLAMDLNGFKILNGEFGHHAGNEVLVQVARRVGSVVRKADTLARVGGDEFALMMEAHPTRAGALFVANKIVDVVQEPMLLENRSIRVGVSIGIAHSADDLDAATLMRRADSAMYAAKRSGSPISEFGRRGAVSTFPEHPGVAARGANHVRDRGA